MVNNLAYTETSRIKRSLQAFSITTATAFSIILAIAYFFALSEKACAQVHSDKANSRAGTAGQVKPKHFQEKQTMVTCRRFIQKNPILGELVVKLIPNAYRVELKNSGCVQLGRGPKWESVLLNEGAKMFLRKEKDNWWSRATGIGTQVTNTTSKKISPKKERVLWMETTRVSIAADPLTLPVDCYYYQDPTIPVLFCKRMATQSAVPHMGGLIVRVKTSNKEGPGSVKLDTLKADKITVPASQFEIPPGFKEVFSPQEVMLGTGADGLKDFLP